MAGVYKSGSLVLLHENLALEICPSYQFVMGKGSDQIRIFSVCPILFFSLLLVQRFCFKLCSYF